MHFYKVVNGVPIVSKIYVIIAVMNNWHTEIRDNRSAVIRRFTMIKAKKIIAAAVAAAAIGTTSTAASAAQTAEPVPVYWSAVYAPGAPGDVNSVRSYEIFIFGGGYDITCTEFIGNYDRAVDVSKTYKINSETDRTEKVATLHATTSSPIFTKNPTFIIGKTITFNFDAYGENGGSCSAYGVLDQHE